MGFISQHIAKLQGHVQKLRKIRDQLATIVRVYWQNVIRPKRTDAPCHLPLLVLIRKDEKERASERINRSINPVRLMGESAADWAGIAWTFLAEVRRRSPLVQCITNFVSMDLMANTLLAAGASPAMLHSLQELPDFTPNADALCVNVGTLTADWLPAMKLAAELAARSGWPWVLDPVAAGASGFRLNACRELVGLKPTVIRGNGSEIIALANASVGPTKVI